MSYSIYKHLQFNAWANGKIVEILKNVNPELLDKEVISSFPTIRKTIYHIWDAELIWLKRIKGESVTTWPSEDIGENNANVLESFLKNSIELENLVKGTDREFLERKITYTNLKGLEFTNSVEDILYHVVNHGSFHRGQLITMLRQLGETKFLSQDLIAYLRQLQPVMN